MKIMDLSGDDGECQVESVSSQTKKSKQGRLPFQTLSRDSPIANKKRKSVASPDIRNAKQAKVTQKNSCKVSKKTEDEDIVIIDEEVEGKEENKINEANDIKDCSKQSVSTETPESKNKKSTPGKGSAKSKKQEPKVQTNSLIKFFKKIENKETKNEKPTSLSQSKESEKKTNVNNKSKEQEKQESKEEKQDSKIEEKQELQDEKKSKKKSDTESTKASAKKPDDESDQNKSEEISVDIESDEDSKKNSEESDDSSNSEDSKDKSELNGSKNMDVDSDDNLISDDDEDDDNDYDKSDTDSKKTEHEETDSRDDTNRTTEVKLHTPTRSKLLNSSGKERKLTPKQIERKMEIQKKKESRAKQRLEREKKLQEERESRKKEKEEKRREREEKEKLLKEQKKKEKEQKELKKQAEIEQKQKEKEAKEEERRKREEAKEEEKKRKEEEKLEAERKKQKAASNFVSFFVAKKPAETKPIEEDNKVERRNFMPFEIKADMRMAPTIRRSLSEIEKTELDKIIKSSEVKKPELYIHKLKDKTYKIKKGERTWPCEANDDIVILEDEEEENSNVVQASNAPVEKHRAKLLLFHENRRPPYWGTWRKRSKTVNPRKPFGKDTQCFDYEVDSDDEWEEEEPGESLHGSDDEKEKDEENPEENEYDVDNEFMVPHGYLSEEEIGADEEDEDDELNPEKQEKKLKILGEQFEAERNTKTTKLKPKVIGCIWLNKENIYPKSTASHSVKFLTMRHAWVRDIPVTLTAPADADGACDPDGGNRQSVASSARKAQALEEATPDLLRLLHGNTNRRGFLVKEFVEYWSKKKEEGNKPLAKTWLHQRITKVATWTTCTEPGPLQDKQCWIVSEEMQTKYLPEEKLSFPNRWTYCLVPRKKSIAELVEKSEEKEKEKEKEKKLVPLITQFTKTLTAEEKQKQLAEKPTTSSSKAVDKSAASSASKTTPLNRPPKRAALISVARGESFPKSPRVSLIDKFVTKDDSSVKEDTLPKKIQEDDDDDDDIMIIDDDDDDKEKNGNVATRFASFDSKVIKKTSNPGIKNDSKKYEDVEIKKEEESDKKNLSNSDVDIIEI